MPKKENVQERTPARWYPDENEPAGYADLVQAFIAEEMATAEGEKASETKTSGDTAG